MYSNCLAIARFDGCLGRSKSDFLVQPEGFDIPFDAEKIHGISTDLAAEQGVGLSAMMERFQEALQKAEFIVGQNVGFDVNIMGCEMHRMGMDTSLLTDKPVLDTCTEKSALLCQIPGGRGGKFKLPNLTELHEHLFGEPFAEAHNATADVEATTRCFLELLRQGHYNTQELQQEDSYLREFQGANPTPIQKIGLNHLNLKSASQKIKDRKKCNGFSKDRYCW